MKLEFLGTRGNTTIASPRHQRHSSLLVAYQGQRVMIDCGADWRDTVWSLRPPAIVLTHAHPDHAWGLRDGAPCPGFATDETWRTMPPFPIADRRTIVPREPFAIGRLQFEALPVTHALCAPAVGYRLSAGRTTIFYVPDVVAIQDRAEALAGIRLYIGDGATLTRPMVRRRGDALFGHTTVHAQLGWCRQAGVRRAIFTHCRSAIIQGEAAGVAERLQVLAAEHGVEAAFAHDDMRIVLR